MGRKKAYLPPPDRPKKKKKSAGLNDSTQICLVFVAPSTPPPPAHPLAAHRSDLFALAVPAGPGCAGLETLGAPINKSNI